MQEIILKPYRVVLILLEVIFVLALTEDKQEVILETLVTGNVSEMWQVALILFLLMTMGRGNFMFRL